MRIDNNKQFDLLLKNALEEYIVEDVDKQLENFQELKEPKYSKRYRDFVESFFNKKEGSKNKNWKRWGSIAAAFLCCCIFFNHNITAGIKEVFNNVLTNQTEISFDVKKSALYVEYNMDEFPEQWNTFYLPSDMINGYKVEKIIGDASEFEIVFINQSGEELRYILSRIDAFELSVDCYEQIKIDAENGYFYESEELKSLITTKVNDGILYKIQIITNSLEKEEMVWILKNIVLLKK